MGFMFKFADDMMYGCHVGKTEGKIEETGKVHFFINAAGAIGEEEHAIVSVVGIAGGGLTAHVGHNSGNQQVLDLEAAQDSFEVRVVERRVAVLENHFFLCLWSQVTMNLAFRGPFDAHAFPPPAHNAAVDMVGVMHVPGIDHRTVVLTKGIDQTLEQRQDGEAAASE